MSLLALLSLLLSDLLWLNALLVSLEQPTVTGALDQRQLELAALADPAVPAALRPAITGDDPLAQLQQALEKQLEPDEGPGLPEPLLQLGLLHSRGGEAPQAEAVWERLSDQVPPEQRALVGALQRDGRLEGDVVEALKQPWLLRPLSERLLCEHLSREPGTCVDAATAQGALWRLLGVTWLPAILLLVGLVALVRELWTQLRGVAPAAPPLRGPDLSLTEVTLLIAGGFVLLGEVLMPQLTAPWVAALLAPLRREAALQQGVQVLLMYGVLMAAPLTILWGMLRGRAAIAPAGGWLQWRWRPLALSLRLALRQVLMLLPPVALVGWLTGLVFGDQGGSNPLLELVLTTDQPLALACFAFTAVVVAPLFEETLFRGVLLPVLGQHWGGGLAVVLSALVFAAAHLSLGELAPLLVLGLGLGWLRLQGGRLGSCALVHGFWNGFTFVNLLLLAG